MEDELKNTDQTEFDVEARLVAVIKYMLITDKKN